MRWTRHPIAHLVPSILFLVLVLGFRRLQREPFLPLLPPAAVLTAAAGVAMYAQAHARLRHAHQYHDLAEDAERFYANPRLTRVQRLVILDQRTGIGDALVALGYFIIAAMLAGLWVLGRYHPGTLQ